MEFRSLLNVPGHVGQRFMEMCNSGLEIIVLRGAIAAAGEERARVPNTLSIC